MAKVEGYVDGERKRRLQDEDLLISVAGGLGRFDEEANVYRKDSDCLECLKDLQRFLRRDDPFSRDVFHRLVQWDLVSTDIVPLIVQYQEDQDIVYNALKILTFLTMPIDPTSDSLYMQCQSLNRIKECFLANDAVAVIVGLLSRPLSRYPRLSEKDILVVQLVLAFVRNLLCIDSSARDLGIDNAAANLAGAEDERKGNLILRLFKDNVLELVMLVAQHCNEKAFKNDAPLILHIVYQIFEGFSPLQLFQKKSIHAGAEGSERARKGTRKAAQHDKKSEKLRGALASALLSEQRARVTSRSNLPMRHRLFSGTFVKKYKDVSQHVVFTQRSSKPSAERDEQTYKPSGKRGKAAQERVLYPMSDDLRDLLVSFADNFLQGGYDILMDSIRPELMHGIGISRLEKEDYIRFFKLSWFCTSYKKLKMEKIDAKELHEKYEATGTSPFSDISSTMGWDMFHLLLTVWQHQIEIPTRSDEKDWDLQASSLALLKEMMYVLDLAYRIGTKADKKAADKLQRKLLHDDLRQSGLFPLLCRMIKSYNMKNQPKSQAGDMMEALYIIIHTFERLDKTERGGFIVRQRASKRRVQSKTDAGSKGEGENANVEGKEVDDANELGAGEPKEKNPSEDVANDGKAEEQTKTGEEKDGGKNVATADKPSGDDAIAGKETEKGGASPQQNKTQRMAPLELLENESETDSDGRMALKESTFDLKHRLSQELTAPLLINTLTFVLENYKSNSKQLNNSVAGILKRIVLPDSLNLLPCVWHLSFLLVMEKILSDSSISGNASFSSLIQICKYITRKLMDRLLPELTEDMDSFQKTAKTSLARITFVDLLFWKNKRDAEMLRDEYGWHNKYAHREAIRKALADEDEACGAGILKSIDKLAPSASKAFTEGDEEELKEAYDKFKDRDDVVDCLVEEMNFRFKPRQMRAELKRLGLAVKSKAKKPKSKLTEEELEKLKELWNKHKGDKNRMKVIAEGLDFKYTTRRLGSELRLMGLMEKQEGPKRAKITGEQVEKLKAAFEKHQTSATFVEDIEAEMDGNLSKAQIKRLLKKHGLERRKITKLADSSDEDSSDEEAGGKAKTSPWELGDSDSDDEDEGSEDESSDDEERQTSGNENSAGGKILEPVEDETMADPGVSTEGNEARPTERHEGAEADPSAEPASPRVVGSDDGDASPSKFRKNKTPPSAAKRLAKKHRITKKSLSQPEATAAAPMTFEDDNVEEDDAVEDLHVTPVDKRKSQIAILDSDSE